MKYVVIIICFLIILTIIQNSMPVVKKIKIENPSLKGIKIVQLSDLHRKKFGSLNSRLVRKIRELSPSLIMMTGDMASRQGTDMLPLEFLMSSCSRICPVYYCLGNHEIDMDIQDYRHLMQTVRKSNVILLRNQSADIEIDNINLHITGLCFSRANFRNSKGGFTGLKPYLISDINEAVGIKENCFTVLLAHNPLYLDTYASWGAELVLSGHVHGGIIRLPFGKGLLSPERKFFPEYSAGIYKKDNTVMYVNSGLGKFRFFNPPEVTFIEFE